MTMRARQRGFNRIVYERRFCAAGGEPPLASGSIVGSEDLPYQGKVEKGRILAHIVCWRRGRDLNPRRGFKPPYSLSRRAPSTTRPPLLFEQNTGNSASLLRTYKVTKGGVSVNEAGDTLQWILKNRNWYLLFLDEKKQKSSDSQNFG